MSEVFLEKATILNRTFELQPTKKKQKYTNKINENEQNARASKSS